MALDVTKPIVWAGEISDEPGGLARALGPLADSGANLEFVIARRRPEAPGRGMLYVAPLEGRAAQQAARTAGLSKADVPTLRVEGADRPGVGRQMLGAIAAEGINLRGVSVASFGRRFIAYIGFNNPDDATKAARILRGFEETARASGGGAGRGRARAMTPGRATSGKADRARSGGGSSMRPARGKTAAR